MCQWSNMWYLFRVVRVLQFSCSKDPFPEFEGNGRNMVGAGDGGAVERDQVWSLNDRPAFSLEVNHHQLFLYQDHQCTGITCRPRATTIIPPP